MFYLKQEVQDFLYKQDPVSKVTEGTKELFLRTFFLMHDFFRYTLLTKRQQITVTSAFNFMNVLGYQIKKFRGCYLDVEYLMRTLTEIYGSQKVVAYLEQNLGELHWDEEDIE